MAGDQDRRILKAAATSKRGKGAAATAAASAAATGAKDAKTFQAGVGGQADAASLLLEGLLLKVRGGWGGEGGQSLEWQHQLPRGLRACL